MDPEQTVSPAAETQNPAPETATEVPVRAEPEATDDAGSKEPAKSDDVAAQVAADAKRLERELRKAQRVNAKLHQELGAARSGRADDAPKDQEADLDKLADHKARVIRFSEHAAQIVNDGKRASADFDQAVTELVREVGPLVGNDGLPTQFMAAVLDVADGVAEQRKLLYHLGKNPELTDDLADLSPLKLAVRLDRIRNDLAEQSKPKPSNAPKPLETVRSASSQAKPPEDMSFKEYDKWRAARRANR